MSSPQTTLPTSENATIQTLRKTAMTRREALGVLGFLPIVGMTSFVAEKQLHVIISGDTSKISEMRFRRMLEELRDFFPKSAKVAVVDSRVQVHVPTAELQFFSWDQPGSVGIQVFDALGDSIDHVRWCHRPTGIVCQILPKFNYREIIRQYRGPLELFDQKMNPIPYRP